MCGKPVPGAPGVPSWGCLGQTGSPGQDSAPGAAWERPCRCPTPCPAPPPRRRQHGGGPAEVRERQDRRLRGAGPPPLLTADCDSRPPPAPSHGSLALQADSFLRKLDPIVHRLQDEVPHARYDRTSLAQLIAQIMQFMEDALGVNVRRCAHHLHSAMKVALWFVKGVG